MSATDHNDVLQARFGEMAAAAEAKDLEALMEFYDDAVVFSENGKVLDKAGLADYLREMWTEQQDLEVGVGASHACDNVLAVTLDASIGVLAESGDVVRVHWPIFFLYAFDLTTMKVIRETGFSDEEALEQKLAALGAA